MTKQDIDNFFSINWVNLERKARNIHRDLRGRGNYCDIMQDAYLYMVTNPTNIQNPEAFFTTRIAQEIKWKGSLHNRAFERWAKDDKLHPDDVYFDDLENKVALEEWYHMTKSAVESYRQKGQVERILADAMFECKLDAKLAAKKFNLPYWQMRKIVNQMKDDMTKETEYATGVRKKIKDFTCPGPYLIAGCGPSIDTVKGRNLSKVTTFGVNDAAMHVELDYHCVIDPIKFMHASRQETIVNTESMVLFTHLASDKVRSKATSICDIEFNKDRGFFPNSTAMCKSNNSPFVAACIAIRLGATSICFAGVDIIGHPNFAGETKLNAARTHYTQLANWCATNGIKVYNLGRKSVLSGIKNIEQVDYDVWIEQVK